jgi:hypothetical protein
VVGIAVGVVGAIALGAAVVLYVRKSKRTSTVVKAVPVGAEGVTSSTGGDVELNGPQIDDGDDCSKI